MMILLGLLVAGAVGAVIIELMARWYVRHSPYRILAPGRVDSMQIDLTTLPALEPTVRYAVNAHGERGEERPRDPNTLRILAAGGSATMCYFLDQHTAWPGALEKRLARLRALAGRPVHVGNVGKSSVDSGSLELMLSRVLPQEPQLDVLLIMVGASDVLRWLEVDAPEDRPVDVNPLDECFLRHPEVQFGWRPKQLALATLYRWRRDSKPNERKGAGKRYAAARRMRANALETRERIPDSSKVIERFERCLGGTLELARRHARHVIVVRQPWFAKDQYSAEELAQFWSGSVGDAYTAEATIFYSPEVVAALMKRIDDSAAAVCAKLGITSVDLTPKLAPSNDNYFDQFHFTPAGSMIVADCVFDAVTKALQLPPEKA